MDNSNLETFYESVTTTTKNLTRVEEVELAKRIEKGDKSAKDKLVESYLRLVIKIAHNYQNQGLDKEDLIQEGTLGLIRAAEKFDWRQGNRFFTYAENWIHSFMQRAVADKSRMIRIPVHQEAKLRKLSKVERELTASNEYEPSIEELAEATDIDVEEINFLRSMSNPVTSMNKKIGDDENAELGDLFVPDQRVDKEFEDLLGSVVPLNVLTAKEREVIELRFGLNSYPRTLEEVGEELGVTRERIRQIEAEALKKLKSAMEAAEGGPS